MSNGRRDFFVYVLFRPETGQPFYVGKGSGRRLSSHETDLRGNNRKANIIRKARREGRDIPKVKVAEGLSEVEAFAREIALIAAIGRVPNGPLINLTDGGEGPAGRVNSPEHKAKLLATHLGAKRSPETRARISAALRGKPKSAAHIAAHAASLRGRKLSDEHRAKISAAHVGRPCAEGTRQALIASNRKRGGQRRT